MNRITKETQTLHFFVTFRDIFMTHNIYFDTLYLQKLSYDWITRRKVKCDFFRDIFVTHKNIIRYTIFRKNVILLNHEGKHKTWHLCMTFLWHTQIYFDTLRDKNIYIRVRYTREVSVNADMFRLCVYIKSTYNMCNLLQITIYIYIK